jgi:hypothetical protein
MSNTLMRQAVFYPYVFGGAAESSLKMRPPVKCQQESTFGFINRSTFRDPDACSQFQSEGNIHMDSLISAIEGVVAAEPEAEIQPDPVQPNDVVIEAQLTQQISALWIEHTRLSADRKTTAKDLRQVRVILAERLFALKSILSRPGRGGQWRSWLREKGINRSTADRLVARHAETLCNHEEDAPNEAISNSLDDSAEKLARVVWARFRKLLVSDEVVIDFIDSIAELAGLGHEQRAEGLLIFKPSLTAAEELPATAPAPPELGLAAAAVGTSNGDVV